MSGYDVSPGGGGGGGGGGTLAVTGVQGGSVAAATGLQVAGMVTETSPGVALQGAITQIIGPVDIAFDDADFQTGIDFATLAEGAVLLDFWIEVVTRFQGYGRFGFTPHFGADGDLNGLLNILAWASDTVTQGTDLAYNANSLTSLLLAAVDSGGRYVPARVLNDCAVTIHPVVSNINYPMLDAAIDDVVDTFVVTAGQEFPAAGAIFTISDDPSEHMLVTDKGVEGATRTIEVTRGHGGTTPVAHDPGMGGELHFLSQPAPSAGLARAYAVIVSPGS